MLTKLVFLQSFYDVLVDQKKKRKGITAETKKKNNKQTETGEKNIEGNTSNRRERNES